MLSYIIRRLLIIIPVLIGVSLVVFFTMHLIPGDPATIMAGPQASQQDIQNLRIRLGLNQPLYMQYLKFLKGIVTLNLGKSIQNRKPVIDMLMTRYPNTIILAVTSMIVATILGLITGIIAAVKQYSIFDNISMIIALLGISLPSFWIGLVLMYIFAVKLRWLPVAGFSGAFWTWDGIRHLIMPAITLGVASAALIARMTRTSMLEIIRNDFVRTARAKGANERTVLLRHVLKNAFIPVVTVIGLNFGALLGGTVITESVFAINGVGRLTVDAINKRDFPVVQGAVLLIALTFVLLNLIVDILYAYLDPRIRYE
jgi:peptide/nickel transport system permease protein